MEKLCAAQDASVGIGESNLVEGSDSGFVPGHAMMVPSTKLKLFGVLDSR